MAAVRSLLFSTLYPSAARPGHGIFVETRLRELLKTGSVDARVVAPVAWFPSRNERFGDRASMARTPAREQRSGIEVLHPRYALVPKLGMSSAPLTLALGALGSLRNLLHSGFDFDVIDAHYFYPDGVAAVLLGAWLGKPVVITARGSDVNLIARYTLPRQWMYWASKRAAALVGVSAALVDRMAELGMPRDRMHVMRNGVDLQRFVPLHRLAARKSTATFGSPLLLSVGNLLPLKGHDLCIDALALLLPAHPLARLAIVGAGPQRAALLAHAQARGVSAAVDLVGSVPNSDLAAWYSAADLLLLASSREGWPNVLLESMACGTPVLATAVGGVPEIVRSPTAGRLVHERSAAALASGVGDMLANMPQRTAVRGYAERFGWNDTSQQQVALFERLAAQGAHHAVA